MKHWTVMLIPHDRGNTRTLKLSIYPFILLAVVLMGLSFTSSFFYARHRATEQRVAALVQAYIQLERADHTSSAPLSTETLTQEQEEAIAREVRAEYEARNAALAAELSELYDLEVEVRKITGLPPRNQAPVEAVAATEGGVGGGPSVFDGPVHVRDKKTMATPPQVIYGLARPSSDLLVQEINLRTDSLRSLLADMRRQDDRIARTPSIWPTTYRNRKITSRFGYRHDPFNSGIRHHDGVDVTAPNGSPVVATADGKVKFAGYRALYGNTVEIEHGDGLSTLYCHMSTLSVAVGDKVERGELIGKVGMTGRTTGPHVHYEVHMKGLPINPQKYFGN